eukprot:5795317-Prymnesium_polylepis.1
MGRASLYVTLELDVCVRCARGGESDPRGARGAHGAARRAPELDCGGRRDCGGCMWLVVRSGA